MTEPEKIINRMENLGGLLEKHKKWGLEAAPLNLAKTLETGELTAYKNMNRADFRIEAETEEYIFIIDIGHTHTCTVTNDAENVVETLARDHALGDRRLFYMDSEGRIDEIKHTAGKFSGFAPGHAGITLPDGGY